MLSMENVFLKGKLILVARFMMTLESYIITFEITPASTDDQKGLRDIIEGGENSGLVIIDRKGYVG